MATPSFYLMISFLVAHELDAMKRHEWRMIPLLNTLPETVAAQIFVWAHVPLTVLLLWIAQQGAASSAAIALAAFSVLHIVLHWLFRNNPDNEFNTIGSWLLILGAGLFGILVLASQPGWLT